jgi:hypothetical protein
MRVMLVCLGFAAVLAGCQTASYEGDVNSPYYVVPAGSRLTLTKELRLEPDQLSVYIQYGRILPFSQVRVYSPFCKFELYDQSDVARTVMPDQMTVTRSFHYQTDGTFSEYAPPHRTQLASTVLFAQMGSGQSPGGPSIYSYVTRMNLHSEKQPEIFRLSCARWAYPGMDEHVTIAEIRRTLSPLFTLRLPNES